LHQLREVQCRVVATCDEDCGRSWVVNDSRPSSVARSLMSPPSLSGENTDISAPSNAPMSRYTALRTSTQLLTYRQFHSLYRGSSITSHRCSVICTGYGCHSGSSSSWQWLSSVACWLGHTLYMNYAACLTQTRNGDFVLHQRWSRTVHQRVTSPLATASPQ